jgi:hypothetical protein
MEGAGGLSRTHGGKKDGILLGRRHSVALEAGEIDFLAKLTVFDGDADVVLNESQDRRRAMARAWRSTNPPSIFLLPRRRQLLGWLSSC